VKLGKKCGMVCVFLFSLVLASSAMAQPSMPDAFIQMYEIQVKSGANQQFEDYLKKIAEAADKVGALQEWTVAQASLGTNGTNYYVVVGFNKWAERDGWNQIPQMLAQAYGDAEAQKILKMGGDAYWGFTTKLFALDEELSWNLEAAPSANFYQILLGKVKPTMVDEYRMVISRIKEAQEKVYGSPMGIRRTSRFGPSWEFYMAVPFEKWGDWDKADYNVWENVAKIHGEETARTLQDTLQNCYEEREIFVVATRPDLSRQAPSPTSNE
jgi:hypothetical protein